MPNSIPIDYPVGGTVSYYSSGVLGVGRDLNILLFDRFDWDVIHHEYGHYVTDLYGIENSPGGNHSSGENLSERIGKDKGIRLAWGEGWPTYFGISLQQEMGTSTFNIPNVGDTRYQDTEDLSIDYDLESQSGHRSLGEDNELSVQRILWDLYDASDDTGDENVSLGDEGVWNALTGAGVVTLSDAWDAVTGGNSVEETTRIGAIFAEHNVAPELTAPDDNAAFDPQSPPTFRWDANGGGPSYRNNRFTVEFWDVTYDSLLLDSGELSQTEFTPSQDDWKAITDSANGMIHWLVRGKNTDSPETGTYVSPSRRLSSGSVDVALIIDSSGSMGSNDPNNMRKEAAKVFVDTMQDSDYVAIVDFDSGTRVPWHIAEVDNDRDTIKSAVDTINSSGGTNIGAGMQEGYNELSSSPTTNKKAAVLLTDGHGDYNNQAALYAAEGWPVYTIGLSSGADAVLLQQIADDTGGEYFLLENPDELINVYFEIIGAILGGETVLDHQTTMNQGETLQLQATVSANQSQATFLVSWPGSEVEMTLKSPSGQELTPTTNDPDVYHAKGLTYELYRITNPEAGVWTMNIYGKELDPGGELVAVQVMQIPSATQEPQKVWRFRGYTYQGQPRDTSTPLGEVALHLYGRNEGEPEPGDWVKTVTSDAGGFFNFYIIEPWNFDYFTLVAESPAGMVSTGVWSADGTVIGTDTVKWDHPEPSVHMNEFYFDMPTPTPPPTNTPTATPTPTSTPTPTTTPTATPTPTYTPTPTATPTDMPEPSYLWLPLIQRP